MSDDLRANRGSFWSQLIFQLLEVVAQGRQQHHRRILVHGAKDHVQKPQRWNATEKNHGGNLNKKPSC